MINRYISKRWEQAMEWISDSRKAYFLNRKLASICLMVLLSSPAWCQEKGVMSGKVLSSYDHRPLEKAVVTIKGTGASVQTDRYGSFKLELPKDASELSIWMPEYYESVIPILNRDSIEVTLIPTTRIKYDLEEFTVKPIGKQQPVLYNKDFRKGIFTIEEAMQGQFAGLNVIPKSGMPTEGSTCSFRGIRSFYADNSPLIVINGIPYLPDMESSPLIGGYSKSVFNPLHVQDVHSIRLLKGPETALYGSMGSNGVLLIETSSAEDLETVIEFKGQYGVAYNRRQLPVLGVSDFKSYIGDVGLTQFEDMGQMLEFFPFLRDDPNYYYNFLYNSNTDWQSEIYRPAFQTDNHLRVKGGDEIAKYDLSLGVLNQAGALDNSAMTRYSTRLNAKLALGKKFDLNAGFGLTYTTSKLHEQGMLYATNPLLTALRQAPILSPYAKDEYNNQLPTYDVVRQFGVSNPLAVLNTMSVKSDIYDVFVNAGLDYKASEHWLINGTLGIYSDYNRQSLFVPGLSSGSIVPLQNGIALNTARAGVGKASNIYFRINSDYHQSYGQNKLQAGIGYQGLIDEQEFDAGFGRNTSSDFYRTLDYVSNDGRYFWGYNEKWNWMSTYGYANYQWNNLLTAAAYLSVDGASSTGMETPRFGFFPGASLTWSIANTAGLKNSKNVNKLDARLGFSRTGNSRYSSKLSKGYYTSQIYRQLSGIVVGNVPNTSMRWEDNYTLEGFLDLGLFDNRLTASGGYYRTQSKNLIQSLPLSPVAGLEQAFFNGAEIENQGFELDLSFALIEKRDVGLTLGANLATNKSQVKSLGGPQERVIEMPDGTALISRVGEAPYSFYGYQAVGVIASAADAAALNLSDYKNDQFGAGDIQFVDKNKDGVIDQQDRFLIGNPNPDFFGGGFVDVRYKQLSLRGYFTFSHGNQQYNAVRKELESMKDFGNQSAAIIKRWKVDGQVTDIPKATYGDPMGNSRFSDRWIEDASFFRLSNLSLSYRFSKPGMKLLEGAELYLIGENLFTFTKYLGLDPATSYNYDRSLTGFDYGKVALPRTFKLGINLTF